MDRFESLKQKYATVLGLIKQRGVVLAHLHVENDKLVMQGSAPTEGIKNEVWNEIKRIDPSYSDLAADINVDSSLPVPQVTYTVQKGDSLWKIAEKHLGKGSLYPKLIEANPGKLKDENTVIHPGDVLLIPQA